MPSGDGAYRTGRDRQIGGAFGGFHHIAHFLYTDAGRADCVLGQQLWRGRLISAPLLGGADSVRPRCLASGREGIAEDRIQLWSAQVDSLTSRCRPSRMPFLANYETQGCAVERDESVSSEKPTEPTRDCRGATRQERAGQGRIRIDANVGGGIDGTRGGDLVSLAKQIDTAQAIGFDGVWSTEVNRDPFLPLVLAASMSRSLLVGTAVAVAFARNPMSMATAANDLSSFSRGRFVLGLGSQVQAHITRRFGMPWSAPAERMTEYLQALRAIWHSWQTGERLDFRGRHYQHTLMTPMFRPEPNPYGPPPVVVAAVGPKMTTVAARSADGLLVHGFTTARYLADVTVPLIDDELRTSGRSRHNFTISYPGLVATGADDRQYQTAVKAVRHQIAFYGATPSYRAVLDLHGWADLHNELHRLSRLGDWATMTNLIDDDVLTTFAVVGEPKDVGPEIVRRYRGLVDRFTLYTPYILDESTKAVVVEDVKSSV